jgi:hypothetical protein
MFCPNCKAEYRAGFTHCVDCDVDLVADLPNGQDGAGVEPGDPNADPFCSFWKGEDARLHAELCEVLDDAGIAHNTIFRRDHLFNLKNYPSYEVGVPFSLFEKAENAVKEAYGTDEVEEVGAGELKGLLLERSPQTIRKLPETLTPSPEDDIPGPPNPGVGLDWFPEDATLRIWLSESESGDFLVAALHENGIHCRLDKTERRQELYVLPEDESRAREIVREIVEGRPPE